MSKNKFVKYASFAAALLFAMSAATPANAKAWTPTSGQTLTDGKYMANTAEDTASSQTYSLVYNESRNDAICQTIGEGSCSATDTISGTYVLGVCTSAADSLCIDQVTIFAQGASTPAPASVIRQIKAPVLTGLPFGHVETKVLLPVGAKVDLVTEGRDALMVWGHI